MDYTESILHLNKIVDPTHMKHLITYIKHRAKKNLNLMGGVVNKSFRNVKGYHLNFETPTNLFYWNFIKKEIERLYIHYKVKFPKMESTKINQIDLLKYSVGDRYLVHTDYSTHSPRHLSIIINLNDDYEGGDLVFTDQKNFETKRLKLSAGSIVFFPSNFMYPHTIEPITKGTRYSIVAWLQ